ncbi:hypothetical protein [Lysobacter gummosus]|uniref:hypothetical protein n=1 Tax=Lysobacter gummosus TaxID=262324 RepID=UPI00362AA2E6
MARSGGNSVAKAGAVIRARMTASFTAGSAEREKVEYAGGRATSLNAASTCGHDAGRAWMRQRPFNGSPRCHLDCRIADAIEPATPWPGRDLRINGCMSRAVIRMQDNGGDVRRMRTQVRR